MFRFPRPYLNVLAAALISLPAAHLHAQGVEDFEDVEFEEPEFEQPEFEQPEYEEYQVEEPDIEEPEAEVPEIEEPESEDLELEQPDVSEPGDEDPEVGNPELEASGSGESDDDQDDEASHAAGSDEDHAGSASEGDWVSDIALVRDVEFDEGGFPVEAGEILALNLTDAARDTLLALGFQISGTVDLLALQSRLTILRIPANGTVQEALSLARRSDPDGTFDFGHFYGAPYDSAGQRDSAQAAPAPPRPARRPTGNLRIGLIDTAVRPGALPGRVSLRSRNFGMEGAAQRSEHGTAVASILAEQGAGELLAANVFANTQNATFTSATAISMAMSWMLENQVEVINVSLSGPHNVVLDALIGRATLQGAVVVAAAGNGGPAAPPAYPAALPDVVAVTAVDANNRVYRYANRGSYVRLAAFGVRVPASMADGSTMYFTGTSFASPRVAILIARCRQGGRTAEQCIAQLERSAVDLGTPGRDEIYGFGLVE